MVDIDPIGSGVPVEELPPMTLRFRRIWWEERYGWSVRILMISGGCT
jgi:hypothetical protein